MTVNIPVGIGGNKGTVLLYNRFADPNREGELSRWRLSPCVCPLSRLVPQNRPAKCAYCGSCLLQRWGSVDNAVKDPHVHQASVYRYHCCQCQRTFRHHPEGLSACPPKPASGWFWRLCVGCSGLSLRGSSAILSAFPVVLSHTSVWKDVQAQAVSPETQTSPPGTGVWGWTACYPKLAGREQPTADRRRPGQRSAPGAGGHPRERLAGGGRSGCSR